MTEHFVTTGDYSVVIFSVSFVCLYVCLSVML